MMVLFPPSLLYLSFVYWFYDISQERKFLSTIYDILQQTRIEAESIRFMYRCIIIMIMFYIMVW